MAILAGAERPTAERAVLRSVHTGIRCIHAASSSSDGIRGRPTRAANRSAYNSAAGSAGHRRSVYDANSPPSDRRCAAGSDSNWFSDPANAAASRDAVTSAFASCTSSDRDPAPATTTGTPATASKSSSSTVTASASGMMSASSWRAASASVPASKRRPASRSSCPRGARRAPRAGLAPSPNTMNTEGRSIIGSNDALMRRIAPGVRATTPISRRPAGGSRSAFAMAASTWPLGGIKGAATGGTSTTRTPLACNTNSRAT